MKPYKVRIVVEYVYEVEAPSEDEAMWIAREELGAGVHAPDTVIDESVEEADE